MDALGIIRDEVAKADATPAGRSAAVRSIGVETLRSALGVGRVARGDQQALIGRGIGASPGLGVGAVVFSADRALDRYEAGEEVILVVDVTTPADEPGMRVAAGIVSRRGDWQVMRQSSRGSGEFPQSVGWTRSPSKAIAGAWAIWSWTSPRSWPSTEPLASCISSMGPCRRRSAAGWQRWP